MTFIERLIYVIKIWVTILLPIVLVVPAIEGFNKYFRALKPTILFSLIFTIFPAITLFIVLWIFEKAGTFYDDLIKPTLIGGIIGFYAGIISFNLYFNGFHILMAFSFLIITMLSCYYWSHKEVKKHRL